MKRFQTKLTASVDAARSKDLLEETWLKSSADSDFRTLEITDEEGMIWDAEDHTAVPKEALEFSQHIDHLLRRRMSTTYAQKKRWRNWIASVLSLLCPSLGHLYQRRWLEATFWISQTSGVVCCTVGLTGRPDVGWMAFFGMGVFAAIGTLKSTTP